eukprot:scaffold279230_cov19-Tisochrysis_lutea.AAC.1
MYCGRRPRIAYLVAATLVQLLPTPRADMMAAAVLMPGMKPQKERHLQQPLVLSRSFLRSFPAMADVAVHSLPSLC